MEGQSDGGVSLSLQEGEQQQKERQEVEGQSDGGVSLSLQEEEQQGELQEVELRPHERQPARSILIHFVADERVGIFNVVSNYTSHTNRLPNEILEKIIIFYLFYLTLPLLFVVI